MINVEALFRVSYGLYIVCSGDASRGNGFISNTVFQVTATPAKFAACCNKNNFTADLIKQFGAFSVSVLKRDASADLIGKFGYQSGRTVDKLAGMQITYGKTGVPVVLDECIATLELKVVQTVDVGTHLLFIGELIQSEMLDEQQEPLTYLYYRQVRKGVSPKNAPTYIETTKQDMLKKDDRFKKFKCLVCGHIYDEAVENTAFADLPDSWTCPVCGAEKSDFEEI